MIETTNTIVKVRYDVYKTNMNGNMEILEINVIIQEQLQN